MSDKHAQGVAEERCEPVKPSMSRIGLVAYCALPPHHVFVRVPNEPGRWLLVHRCVVDVACSNCGAAEGEPCHNKKAVRRYGVGTHTLRRYAYDYRRRRSDPTQHKPHLSTNDLAEANREFA